MKSAKSKGKRRVTGGSDPLSSHLLTLHQRLSDSLSLGIRHEAGNRRKWQSTDAEIQGLAVRSMSAFVSCLSTDLSRYPLFQDSIYDMLVALEGLLQSGNETVLSLAADVSVKLLDALGSNSIPKFSCSELIPPLSRLLSSQRSSITVSCAIALNIILMKLTPWKVENREEVWKSLEGTNAVGSAISALQDYVSGVQIPLDHFREMASLLKTILWWWPTSRYTVWSNSELISGLGALCKRSEPSVAITVLQLYSSLALCGDVAIKLLKNVETFIPVIIHCIGSSQPRNVRIEAFRLLQTIVRSEKGCAMLTVLYYGPIVEGIINAMGAWRSSCSGKLPSDQVPLVLEACRSALMTRSAGEHHGYFWKFGIDRVLVDLLLNNSAIGDQLLPDFSLDKQLNAVNKRVFINTVPIIRPYLWDILGWLAIHCEDDLNPSINGDGSSLDVLISYACSVAFGAIHKWGHLPHEDLSSTSEREPVSRAVLFLIFSPCKYIASRARHFLSEALKPNGDQYLKLLLDTLDLTNAENDVTMFDNLRCIINMIGLACYSSLSQYRDSLVKFNCIEKLSVFIRKYSINDMCVPRLNIAPHLHIKSDARTCCWAQTEDWEGGDVLLFFSLWALVELVRDSDFVQNHKEITSRLLNIGLNSEKSKSQVLADRLIEICSDDSFSLGVRWYAAYCLSFFGLYGFPTKFGRRIGKALNEKVFSDMQLILPNGQSLSVHGVILSARCPSLIPPGRAHPKENPSGQASLRENIFCDNGCTVKQDIVQMHRKFYQEVRLSTRVHNDAMKKLLEYIYTGFLQVDNDLVKQLKMLAKHCKLQTLLSFLSGKPPKWGSAISISDITSALGTVGHAFSDIILEAQATEGMSRICSICVLPNPHLHVHKVILWSSCDYLRALFQSGMQDSCPKTITVPVSWEALVKLAFWFYSGVIPRPSVGCLWKNMGAEHQLRELEVYVELSWLAEVWFMEDVQEDILNVVISCLKTNQHLSLKIIQLAAKLCQGRIVEVAAYYIAPLYPQLRDKGDLGVLDGRLLDIVRTTYVRLSQE